MLKISAMAIHLGNYRKYFTGLRQMQVRFVCRMLYAWTDYETMGPWAQICKSPHPSEKKNSPLATVCGHFASLVV